jgi:hypothetical protein
MKLQLLVVTLIVSALPAFAAPCPAPQVPVGPNCVLSTTLGWVIAGLQTDSIVTFYVPPSATGPITFQPTSLNSSLGTTYTGFFGIVTGTPGQPGAFGVTTLANIGSVTVAPGQQQQFLITQVCWDPTCTTAAPAGAVPNMFSIQVDMVSPNPGDISLTPNPQLTVQFLKGAQVTFEASESALRSNSLFSYIPNVNLGATPAGRYVFTGAAVTLPYNTLTLTNINTGPITGTATLQDANGNNIASAPIPAIPANGAAGYLVIGRTPGDPLGLFPSSTVLPAGPDGIFHGMLIIGMSGQTVNGQLLIIAQEFNGNSMLSLPVFHGPVF